MHSKFKTGLVCGSLFNQQTIQQYRELQYRKYSVHIITALWPRLTHCGTYRLALRETSSVLWQVSFPCPTTAFNKRNILVEPLSSLMTQTSMRSYWVTYTHCWLTWCNSLFYSKLFHFFLLSYWYSEAVSSDNPCLALHFWIIKSSYSCYDSWRFFSVYKRSILPAIFTVTNVKE